MLELDDVHVAYGDSQIIQGVSLRVDEGEVVALLGRNGVGKTTLIRAICGLTPARTGTHERLTEAQGWAMNPIPGLSSTGRRPLGPRSRARPPRPRSP